MPPPPENFAALNRLEKQYKCVMVAAGNAQRVYKQMGNYPIDIVANYGMQETKVINGKFTVVKAVTNTVDRAFFREKTDYLRKKYGYTEYFGEPLEFHPSGMVTFGLLGTTPPQEKKLAFDPDRKKRRAMYKSAMPKFTMAGSTARHSTTATGQRMVTSPTVGMPATGAASRSTRPRRFTPW